MEACYSGMIWHISFTRINHKFRIIFSCILVRTFSNSNGYIISRLLNCSSSSFAKILLLRLGGHAAKIICNYICSVLYESKMIKKSVFQICMRLAFISHVGNTVN